MASISREEFTHPQFPHSCYPISKTSFTSNRTFGLAMPLPGQNDLAENEEEVEGSRKSQPAKRPRYSCRFNDKPMELLEEMKRMLSKQNEKIESMYRENQELREEVSFLKADISRFRGYLQHSPVPRMLSDTDCSLPLRFQFLNSCGNDDKYSTHWIEADDKSLLKVAICDHNRKIITCEPFSSMRVHIVAINGDSDDDHKGRWTEKDFCDQIITGRAGKEFLFGNLYFRLQDGVGYLNSVKFQDNSSFVRSKRIKLGVMAADERISERIQEGITESFAVKDIRGFSTKKSCNPSPHDPVHKLSRIAMNGDRHKLLEQNGIKTVGDLLCCLQAHDPLCCYSKSPDDLHNIMGKIPEQDWNKIITHAHKCKPRAVSHEHELFSRSNSSCYLMQPNPTKQKEFDNCTDQQVTSIRNEVLPAPATDNNASKEPSLRNGHSLESKRMPEGDIMPGAIDDCLCLPLLETSLFEDEAWGDFYFGETSLGDNSNVVEHSGGLSSVNDARNMSYGGRSPASEAGSAIYGGLSPAGEVGNGWFVETTGNSHLHR